MTTKPLRIDGIDLSSHQNQWINYPAAKKAGVKFIYHKATEGHTFRDPNYAKRRAESKANALPFGGYHYAHPAPDNAVLEAQYFLAYAKPVPGDMLPVLDLEVNEHNMSEAALTAWVEQWWATVKHALGRVNDPRCALGVRSCRLGLRARGQSGT